MSKALDHLLADGIIDAVISRLKTGKEAEIFLVEHKGEIVAAKIYKEQHARNFKHRAQYGEGRTVRNTRTQRAMDKGSKFGKASEEEAWKATESDALYKLHAAGMRVPQPVLFYEGILLMEVVIDAEGHPAPRLIDAQVPKERAAEMYFDLRAQVIKMLCADLIHGDLSPYNVLMAWNGPTIIDFPQVVGAAHNRQAESFFERDLRALQKHFAAIDPTLHGHADDARQIWKAYERRELTPDFVPVRNERPPQREFVPEGRREFVPGAPRGGHGERHGGGPRNDQRGHGGGPRGGHGGSHGHGGERAPRTEQGGHGHTGDKTQRGAQGGHGHAADRQQRGAHGGNGHQGERGPRTEHRGHAHAGERGPRAQHASHAQASENGPRTHHGGHAQANEHGPRTHHGGHAHAGERGPRNHHGGHPHAGERGPRTEHAGHSHDRGSRAPHEGRAPSTEHAPRNGSHGHSRNDARPNGHGSGGGHGRGQHAAGQPNSPSGRGGHDQQKGRGGNGGHQNRDASSPRQGGRPQRQSGPQVSYAPRPASQQPTEGESQRSAGPSVTPPRSRE